MKHYNKRDELLVGYDPRPLLQPCCRAGKAEYGRRLRIIKEFYCCYPDEQPELARQFYEFFGADSLNKRYHPSIPDRAGNKRREELEQITTDSRALKRELESYGFEVELMNEGQATVYHWQQFKLLLLCLEAGAMPCRKF